MPRRKNPGRQWGGQPKHAGRLLARTLREGRLDKRTTIARAHRELITAYTEHIGGSPTVTQVALIDRIAFVELVCATIENHVLAAGSPLDKDGMLLPVLGQNYTTWAAQLARMVGQLGLAPHERPALELHTYLRGATAPNTAPDAQRGRVRDAAPEADTDETDTDSDAVEATLSSDSDTDEETGT